MRRGVPGRRPGTRARLGLILGAVAGALLAYFLDPDRGQRRRTQVADRVKGALPHHLVHLRSGRPATDDATIADRVENEVFRLTGLPRGGVTVDVHNGVVVIDGELSHEDEIRALERAVRRIDGVMGVENRVHLPGAPAPTQAEMGGETGG
jgi:hypothetical protein